MSSNLPWLTSLRILCSSASWVWCIFWGLQGQSLLAASGAIYFIILYLYFTKKQDITIYLHNLLLMLFSIPLGFVLESFLMQTGFIQYAYANPSALFPPLWVICLYPLFALLLNHFSNSINNHPLALFLCGFLFMPLIYFAAHSLGGLHFSYPLLPTWLVLGTCWAALVFLLTRIANHIERATAETLKERHATNSLQLLYDGDCPLCTREICMLRKKDTYGKTTFVDIASKEFSRLQPQNIDYNTAMAQIHAIDSKGNVLVGIPAFAAVYARSQLLVASTLLRLGFLQRILNPLYTLFAKNRLWITGRSPTQLKK